MVQTVSAIYSFFLVVNNGRLYFFILQCSKQDKDGQEAGEGTERKKYFCCQSR